MGFVVFQWLKLIIFDLSVFKIWIHFISSLEFCFQSFEKSLFIKYMRLFYVNSSSIGNLDFEMDAQIHFINAQVTFKPCEMQ